MKIRDYEKWLDEDYSTSNRISKKSSLKKMKKFEQTNLDRDESIVKKKFKK